MAAILLNVQMRKDKRRDGAVRKGRRKRRGSGKRGSDKRDGDERVVRGMVIRREANTTVTM